MRKSRTETLRVFLLALLLAAAVLLFCSKSSPAYPINDWTDANIYFSVGKGMANGLVVYRDLYDHKGPLIYALHALCALLSPMNFTAVYALECVCAAAFLTLAYNLMRLLGLKRTLCYAVALTALAVYCSYSFQQGDSAEELCLPLMLYGLYALIKWQTRSEYKPMSFSSVMVQGMLFGCIFWTKFTLIGAQAAFIIILVFSALKRRDAKQALVYIGAYAAGFALSTVPWIIYFGANGAILDWLKVYLYDNLFLYSGAEGAGLLARVKLIAKSGLDWLIQNPFYTVPIIIGLIWLVFRRKTVKSMHWAVLFMSFLAALGVFIGGKSYPYYGLALAFLCPLGFAAIGSAIERASSNRKAGSKAVQSLIAAAFAVCAAASCHMLSPNVKTGFLMPREETMQYKLAAEINRFESPTLLNYGFMDAGFYTATGIVPSVKYFHQTNVPLDEMLSEQIRYIDEGICGFVVTRGRQPASIDERYDMVATAPSPEGFWYDNVYLYRLKELGE